MNNIMNHPAGSGIPTKLKSLMFAGLIAGAIAVASFVPAQRVNAQDSSVGNPFTLAGSWKMTVGAAPGPVFTAYETFTEAGGSVEINNGPGGSTTGIGTWVRTAPRTFLATIVKQQFDGAGNFILTTKVRREITIGASGNELSGRDNVDLFDPAGNRVPVEIPPSTFSGVRLAPEPLSR